MTKTVETDVALGNLTRGDYFRIDHSETVFIFREAYEPGDYGATILRIANADDPRRETSHLIADVSQHTFTVIEPDEWQ